MGNKEHRRETGNSRRETRNRDVRQRTKDGRKGTDTWDRRHRTLDKGRENGAGERMPRKKTLFNSKKKEKWAYAERISSLAEHTRKWFHRRLSIRGNVQKSNISAEPNTIFINLLLQALGTIRFWFLQKKSTNKFHACVPLSCSKVVSLWFPV